MRVKYNRVSTLGQSGIRFSVDTEKYDLVLLDKISGSIGFKDRPKGKELTKLVDEGKVTDLVVEEFSRLGRNTGDVIRTLEWLEEKEVNVIVRNMGLQSRPDQKKNPIWKMISSVMSSLYEMELENIKERTMVGRQVYVQNGGILGRPSGSNESELSFLKKEMSINVLKSLKKGLTIRETSKVLGISTRSVMKVKKISSKHNKINNEIVTNLN
jgi:DNA invertase Pin-like site-specific DNA recombinase